MNFIANVAIGVLNVVGKLIFLLSIFLTMAVYVLSVCALLALICFAIGFGFTTGANFAWSQ